ncbi:Panacea domain-containing protein [Streptomyces sp. NPDC059788]|uniref:Panacea domain-containing protein n=1 Tax=Streptomyces sp. NPDC059788 TaxID=3346948 RepID=UPI00365A6B3C
MFDVAGYLLQKHAEESPDRPAMTTMKLRKLVYHCQSWHLAGGGEALFPEATRNWTSGPVCPEFQELHQDYFTVQTGFFAEELRVCSDVETTPPRPE